MLLLCWQFTGEDTSALSQVDILRITRLKKETIVVEHD